MKAAVNTEYGPPEVVQIKDIPKPSPKDNEVLVKVHATTVNRTDCGFRKPEYFIVRLISGLFKPKRQVLGTEFAGTIESIGKKVSEFAIRDEVFGLNTMKFGAHAEYLCVNEKGSIALKPSNYSFEEAAVIGDGAFLALTYIRKINFEKKPNILINGASGSIGSAGLQFAKYFGASVTAVCNTNSLELIKSLGADKVIDYTAEDFTKLDDQFDVVFDAVGKSSFFKTKKLLKPRGIYFSTELGYLWQNVLLSLLIPIFGGKKVMFPIPKDKKEDIMFFKELIESGRYKAIIDRTYPLEEIVDAYKYVETGQKTGNVVIKII